MSKADKSKSPLVEAVLALDEQFAELDRVGEKIVEAPMKSESDIDQMRKLLTRFAEYGQSISDNVTKLAQNLAEARARAEIIATAVAKRADELNGVNNSQQEVWNRFRALNEKVQGLNQAISALRRPEGGEFTEEDRKMLAESLGQFDSQFDPLIEESQNIRQEARVLNIKTLESNADSLAQTLQSVRQKIRVLNTQPSPLN